jgi:hypothetical protein
MTVRSTQRSNEARKQGSKEATKRVAQVSPLRPGMTKLMRTHACFNQPSESSQADSNCEGKAPGEVAAQSPAWWAHQDLNLEPTDYESAALTN